MTNVFHIRMWYMKVESWILFLWLTRCHHRNHFRWFRVHCKKMWQTWFSLLKNAILMNNDAFLQFHGHIRTRQQMQKNTVNVEAKKNKQERRQSENMFPNSLRANHQELLNYGPEARKNSFWKSWRITIQTSTNSIYSSIKTRESDTQVKKTTSRNQTLPSKLTTTVHTKDGGLLMRDHQHVQ